MFSEDAGKHAAQGRKRRSVAFKATVVDMEERVLMSGTVARLPRHIQVAPAVYNARIAKTVIQPTQHAARQIRVARTIRPIMRARGAQLTSTINVQPTINVQTSIQPPTGTTSTPAPTPVTPTPASSATPTPTPTPVPQTPASSATPTPTSTPSPTPVPQTPASSATPTPTPTSTPSPTPTPTPVTETPSPTPTPTPVTETPSPTPTPTPSSTDGGLADNIFVKNATTGDLSFYVDGILHRVSPEVSAKLNLADSQITTIDDTTYKLFTKGNDYFPDGAYLQNRQTGEISIYGGGYRHLVTTPIANYLGVTSANTIPISVAQYVGVPQANDYIPDGVFLQNSFTGQIGQYGNGTFRAVSLQVAGILKLSPSQIIQISNDQYTRLTKPNEYYPEGVFIENQSTGEISLYSGGQLHWLSPAVVAIVNPPLSNTVLETPANYAVIPKGNDYFPEGMIIQNKKTSEISIYQSGKRHRITAAVAKQMNLTSSQAVVITNSQYAGIPKGADYVLTG